MTDKDIDKTIDEMMRSLEKKYSYNINNINNQISQINSSASQARLSQDQAFQDEKDKLVDYYRQKMAEYNKNQYVPINPFPWSPAGHICPNCGKSIDGDLAYKLHLGKCVGRTLSTPGKTSGPKKIKPIKELESLIDGLYE